jgi:cell division protease FtsH
MTPPMDRGPKPPSDQPPQRSRWQRWLLPIGLLLAVALFVGPSLFSPQAEKMNYTQFVSAVDTGQVKDISVSSTGAISGDLTNGKQFTTQLPTALGATDLPQRLQAHNVAISATSSASPWWSLLLSFAPLLC